MGRLILKDFVTGKLLLCRAPPQQDQAVKKPLVVYNEVDDLSLEESFPELRMNGLAHVRGKKQRGPILIGSSRIEDPNTKKHGNRKKREKIRRIYTDPA